MSGSDDFERLRARRRFIGRMGAAVAASLSLPCAWARASDAPRTLSFAHTHTGESLTATYFRDGIYQPAALGHIDHLLRDFRTGDVHPIDPGVLDILFDLRALADRDEAFAVVSGYRSPHTNAALRSRSSGVAEHSLHMQGRAIDVRLPGFPTSKLHELALQMQRGGVGFYRASDFVHLDTGRVRFW
jgi:uncharacterized protein YcbK (DUF882 family)